MINTVGPNWPYFYGVDSFMHKAIAISMASIFFIAAGAAKADIELIKSSNCMACHAIDKKRLGPSMTSIADKYRGDNTAAAKLAKKIQQGGVGVWGQMPMPMQSQVSDADAKTLAEYILSL
jgi:cytochrome c